MQTFATNDGARLQFHVLGDLASSEPAIVVPGGPCRGVEYLGDLAGVGAIRPLVVLHPRGTPSSGGLSRGWWRDAADIVALADHLRLKAFDLVAHSAGTRLALATASQESGSRIRSLTLITPPATWLSGVADDGNRLALRRHDPVVDAAIASMG